MRFYTQDIEIILFNKNIVAQREALHVHSQKF